MYGSGDLVFLAIGFNGNHDLKRLLCRHLAANLSDQASLLALRVVRPVCSSKDL